MVHFNRYMKLSLCNSVFKKAAGKMYNQIRIKMIREVMGLPLKCEVVHNPNRTEEDDRVTYRRICEIYREFHEREAVRKAAEQQKPSTQDFETRKK